MPQRGRKASSRSPGRARRPALSNAVLDEVTAGWRRIDTIEIGIAPANQTPRGLAVIRSILSYAGRPVSVFWHGAWRTQSGWGLTTRRKIGKLGRRWLSLCETPDLDIVPARFDVTQSAVFRGGLELSFLHLGLSAASWPVRIRLLRSLAPAARSFKFVADILGGLGSDNGGMIVEVAGLDATGAAARATWTMVVESGHGPFIPTLPALAAIRAIARGEVEPGARACVGVLGLSQIAAEFQPYRITTERTVVRS